MTAGNLPMRHCQWKSIILTSLLVFTACGHQATISRDPTPKQSGQLASLGYSIQVGAFRQLENAAGFARALERRGLDAYYFADRDGLFKVRFGDFASIDQAREKATQLASGGTIEEYFIVRPDRYHRYGEAVLRGRIVRTAEGYIGLPYRWGGVSAEKGFDCSGLTMTVYRLNGLNLPRSSKQQYNTGTPIPRSGLREGDLVFFATSGGRKVSHVGIYAGNGSFIHAPRSGGKIRFESLSNKYFRQRYIGARTYLSMR